MNSTNQPASVPENIPNPTWSPLAVAAWYSTLNTIERKPFVAGGGRGAGAGQVWGPTPSIMLFSYTNERAGDITGAGSGKGKAAKRARAVGVGVDEETRRASEQAERAAQWPWIAEAMASENDTGDRLLALAFGKEWRRGRGLNLNGGGCAARAARWLWKRRAVRGQGEGGAMPSSTSIEAAAADAAGAMWQTLSRRRGVVPAHWERSRFVALLWRVGWRAAKASISATGFTGDNSAMPSTVPLDAGELAIEARSLQTWADNSGVPIETTDVTARRAVNSFLWRSLVPMGRARGGAAATARKAAIQRARFLIRLNHGQGVPDASRLAGYESPRAALEAMRKAKVIETLKQAAGAGWRKLPGLASLAERARLAGAAAGRAVKRARAVASLARAGGAMGYASSVRRVWRNGRGAGGWVNGTGGGIVTLTKPRRVRIASPLASGWRQAVEERARAVETAKVATNRLARARQAQAAAFDAALSGWRRGWTR
jgi:hypothetical protein